MSMVYCRSMEKLTNDGGLRYRMTQGYYSQSVYFRMSPTLTLGQFKYQDFPFQFKSWEKKTFNKTTQILLIFLVEI